MAHNQHLRSLLLLVKPTFSASPEHLYIDRLCGGSWRSMCLADFPTAESWQTQALSLQDSFSYSGNACSLCFYYLGPTWSGLTIYLLIHLLAILTVL